MSASLASRLEARFGLHARGSSISREAMGGLSSFMAAAYLVVVIPGLLAHGGVDRAAATTATILIMVAGSLAMGAFANFPFIVGPGLGGAAILGVTLGQVEHVPWQAGLGIAMCSGLLFLALTLSGGRQYIVRLVPPSIKVGLGASIGLFIALLGCRDAGMVAVNAKAGALALGDFSQPGPIVALIGLGVAVALQGRRIPGAVLGGILAATIAGIPLGLTALHGAPVALPTGLAATAGQVDLRAALNLAALPYLFAFFAGEFFSTLGTTLAVGAKAELTDEQGNLPGIGKPFMIDAVTATLGPVIGVPAGTVLVESAVGVEAGGRTGLTAIFAALLFFATLLFTPLAMAIPKQATAPALILIGVSMLGTLRHAASHAAEDLLPTILMVLITLISNSFGTGIAAGIVSYVLVRLLSGRWRDLSPGLVLLAIPLTYYFIVAATARH